MICNVFLFDLCNFCPIEGFIKRTNSEESSVSGIRLLGLCCYTASNQLMGVICLWITLHWILFWFGFSAACKDNLTKNVLYCIILKADCELAFIIPIKYECNLFCHGAKDSAVEKCWCREPSKFRHDDIWKHDAVTSAVKIFGKNK